MINVRLFAKHQFGEKHTLHWVNCDSGGLFRRLHFVLWIAPAHAPAPETVIQLNLSRCHCQYISIPRCTVRCLEDLSLVSNISPAQAARYVTKKEQYIIIIIYTKMYVNILFWMICPVFYDLDYLPSLILYVELISISSYFILGRFVTNFVLKVNWKRDLFFYRVSYTE